MAGDENEKYIIRKMIYFITGTEEIIDDLLFENLEILRKNCNAIGKIDDVIYEIGSYCSNYSSKGIDLTVDEILSQGKYTDIVKQILYLFYLGSLRIDGRWVRCGWRQHESGLAWKLLKTHAPMTRGGQTFGDWSCV